MNIFHAEGIGFVHFQEYYQSAVKRLIVIVKCTRIQLCDIHKLNNEINSQFVVFIRCTSRHHCNQVEVDA